MGKYEHLASSRAKAILRTKKLCADGLKPTRTEHGGRGMILGKSKPEDGEKRVWARGQ